MCFWIIFIHSPGALIKKCYKKLSLIWSNSYSFIIILLQLAVFAQVAYSDKKTSPHKRIIWTCGWSHDGKYFFTGSRDKLVVAWDASTWQSLGQPLVLPDSVTAVASPTLPCQPYRLAVGLETGNICLYAWAAEQFSLLTTLDNEAAHHLAITRLSFSPASSNLLASCSRDHVLKIYNITVASWFKSKYIK